MARGLLRPPRTRLRLLVGAPAGRRPLPRRPALAIRRAVRASRASAGTDRGTRLLLRRDHPAGPGLPAALRRGGRSRPVLPPGELDGAARPLVRRDPSAGPARSLCGDRLPLGARATGASVVP